MKRLIALLFALALFVAPMNGSARPSFLNSVRPLQALLTNPDTGMKAIRNICTTTSINQKKHYWLTAAHCVGDLRKHTLYSDAMFVEDHPAEVVDVAFDKDLAVISVAELSVPSVHMQLSSATWMQPVIIAGHPFGYTPLFVTQGWVANPYAWLDDSDDMPYMLLNVAVAPGNSGSCVFNSKGEVVSVLQIGWGREFSPVSGGAPYASLITFAYPYFIAK